MFDIIANIKELKGLSISKVLVFSSFILIVLSFIRKNIPDVNGDFLKTLSFFSKKFGYENWSSILLIFQIVLAAIVVVLFFLYLFCLIVYSVYWKRQRNAPFLNALREDWMLNKLPAYLVLSSVSYLNLIGYYFVLEIKTIDYFIPMIISISFSFLLFLAFLGKYLIQNSD
ncbi:hypothetical protein [Paenibacillus sp. BJ-4]|uniref:hypothetical protein n=1 Tax=Paenibacillus sp. BJ-4 TaxID=2878097 RepID=UPI001CF06E9B|nr:hypothetical protein [Paenibacillus sp. BJ-4]